MWRNDLMSSKTERYASNLKDKILEKNEGFKSYFIRKIKNLSMSSQANNLNALNQFFSIIGKYDARELTPEDIDRFLDSKKLNKLKNKSKNTYIICIGKYLKYHKRFDLVEIFNKFPEKEQEINKNKLIYRDDLDKILKCVNIMKKTMIMVNYEAALRRKELVFIRFKDIQFMDGYINLYINESKTTERNLPLIESMPYLIEYFSTRNFGDEDRIFRYTPASLTGLYTTIGEKVQKRYPGWNKHLHPHLLRHSRFYELARLRLLNEPQLRRFGGFSKNSTTPSIYYHLDDSDVREILLSENGLEAPKKKQRKTFKSMICEICGSKNNQQNITCWRCNHIFDKERFVLGKAKEQDKMDNIIQIITGLTNLVKEFVYKPFVEAEHGSDKDRISARKVTLQIKDILNRVDMLKE